MVTPPNWRTKKVRRGAGLWASNDQLRALDFFPPLAFGLLPRGEPVEASLGPMGGPGAEDRSTPDLHDVAFALWGLSIVQHILFNAAGPDLTRLGFLTAAQKLKVAVTPDNTPAGDIVDVYTPLTFSPTDKFGGESMHILWANCNRPGYDYFERNGKLLTTADL